MRTWLKQFFVAFVMVFILGSVFYPAVSFGQADDTLPTDLNFTDTTTSSSGNGAPLLSAGNANQNQTLEQTGSAFQRSDSALPACGIIPASQGTFEGCFVRFFYYVFLYPSAWLAGIAGQIFDYFIAFTLNSESYHSGGFVEKGWTIVRDLANASFIFILLYVAIHHIVNSEKAGLTKTVTMTILVAVIINFSLFTTRVIIDAGNILGRVFYERIVVENDSLAETTNYTTISAGLVGKVNPQKLLSPDIFRKKYSTTTSDTSTQSNTLGGFSNVNNATGMSDEGFAVGSGFMILVILVAAGINLMLVWIFVSVSIFLIARTLGLWIMMIMSPIAFASLSIPFLQKNVKGYGFSDWISKTFSLSFMIVVFMFFLYLTIMFIDVSFETILKISGDAENMSTVHLFMSVIIPSVAIWFLLNTAKNQAKSMSGEFADMVGKALKYGTIATLGAAGLALGAAAGVGAVAGRQVGGRLGAKMAAGADTSTAMGRFKKRTGNYFANAKYDARNINIPKPAKSIIGVGKSGLSYATDGALGANDFNLKNLNTFGKPSDKSYVQRKEDRVKKIVSEAKDFAPTDLTSVEILDSTGTKTIKTSISEAQKILDRKRIDIKQANDYDDKLKARDKQKKVLDEVKRDYDTSLREYSQGKITDIELASVKRALDAAKKSHDDKTKDIKDLEKLWSSEEKTLNDAKKALAKKKTEFFKNYSKTVDDWAAFPDAKATYRYDANKDAADEIENLGIKEEKKEEKKDDKK